MNEKFFKEAKKKPELFQREVQPKAAVEIIPDEKLFFGCSAKEIEPKSVLKKGDSVIFDFGEHIVGYFSFRLSYVDEIPDAPVTLDIKFAETPYEMYRDFDSYRGVLSPSWLQQDVIHCDYYGAYNLERRYSFRYVRICVKETPQPVVVNNLRALAVTSADYSRVEPLLSEDRALIEIDRISEKTLSECMQYVYEDGPKRDRRLWLGDLRIQALTDYTLFKNYALAKRCLYMFAYSMNEDGLVSPCIFDNPEMVAVDGYHFLDYSLMFAVSLLDYYENTRDSITAEELYLTAKSQIDSALSLIDSDGIIKMNGKWDFFIDWSPTLKKLTSMQGVLLYAVEKFVLLASYLGKKTDENKYRDILINLRKSSRDRLYDKEKNAFVNAYDDNTYSVMSQAWMVLGGAVDKAEAEAILSKALSSEAEKPFTPYAHHYVAEALIRADMRDAARQYVINYWGKMAALGADTFWEVFAENNPHFSPYGDDLINSSCHAWSCSPSYFIRKYFA